MSEVGRLGFIADIGATNARFALVDEEGAIGQQKTLSCRDFPAIEEAMLAYLGNEVGGRRITAAALAVACPVTGDRVTFTNSSWWFSGEALKRRFGLDRLAVVNDFEANALAIPHLGREDRVEIGAGSAQPNAAIGVIGPGSGLGVAALVHGPQGWIALPGEGGHATMAAADEREAAVLDRLRRRFDHVSAERVLSGPGLVNLYAALGELAGETSRELSPAGVAESAEPLAREAVDMFCAMLGTVAGNLALTLGARGGVYIAGGIVPKLGERFARSAFRERFVAKGRFRDYLADIPTFVITHPVPAFLGLARLVSAPG
jgi:glucokinase